MESSQAGPSRLPASSSSASNAVNRPDRLFVGNLAPTVDEYTLLQVFSKFGKITKLDLMYHKTGVLKGKPRGYAFVEFVNKDDALKAMTKLHDRLLRGRKLVVTPANSAPVSDIPYTHAKGRRTTEAPKTTTLSLLKSKKHHQSTESQIAAMEAKLAAMARTKPADENYIPGVSPYQPLLTPGGSTSASPAPDEVFNDVSPLRENSHSVKEERLEPSTAVKIEADELEKSVLAELAKDETLSLPSRPPSASLSPRPDVPKFVTQSESLKRGLASLPKRPAF